MNTFVDCQTGNLTQIMVGVGTYRTDAIRTEGHPFRIPSVNLFETFFANHCSNRNILYTILQNVGVLRGE